MVGPTGNWDFGASSGFTAKYKSTKKLFETSVLCEVNRNEFIISQNPTLRKNNDVTSELLKPFITGSDFNNYTISEDSANIGSFVWNRQINKN